MPTRPLLAGLATLALGCGGPVPPPDTDRALVFSQWSGEISVVDLAEPAKTDTMVLSSCGRGAF